jgi:hypothetical protein
MYIQKYTKVESTQHLVIVGTKKSLTGNSDIKELPVILGDFLKVFLKSDKKSDYLKSADSIAYFIKGDQDAEKLRVAGSAVQKDDNAPFIPTNAEVIAKKEGPIESLSNAGQIGTTNYTVFTSERLLTIKLDENGKTYVAIVANNAYVPANAEVLTLVVKGYMMG